MAVVERRLRQPSLDQQVAGLDAGAGVERHAQHAPLDFGAEHHALEALQRADRVDRGAPFLRRGQGGDHRRRDRLPGGLSRLRLADLKIFEAEDGAEDTHGRQHDEHDAFIHEKRVGLRLAMTRRQQGASKVCLM